MLIFHTTDRESGVARYEIQIGDGEFKLATSPYVLSPGEEDEQITVRAIDHAGNERTVVYERKPAEQHTSWIFVIMLLGILILLTLALVFWKKCTKI